MLTPTTNQGTPTQTGAEERGKQRAATEESNTSKLLVLLNEMKEKMKERDEKLREELRWRDIHVEEKIRKKEETLIVALQERDKEWR